MAIRTRTENFIIDNEGEGVDVGEELADAHPALMFTPPGATGPRAGHVVLTFQPGLGDQGMNRLQEFIDCPATQIKDQYIIGVKLIAEVGRGETVTLIQEAFNLGIFDHLTIIDICKELFDHYTGAGATRNPTRRESSSDQSLNTGQSSEGGSSGEASFPAPSRS